MVIPTSSGEKSTLLLKAGQKVMVLKSQKGVYMQLETGKIIAIRTTKGRAGLFGAAPTANNSPSTSSSGPGKTFENRRYFYLQNIFRFYKTRVRW